MLTKITDSLYIDLGTIKAVKKEQGMNINGDMHGKYICVIFRDGESRDCMMMPDDMEFGIPFMQKLDEYCEKSIKQGDIKMTINDLDLSTRSYNALMNNQITTIEQLLHQTEIHLRKLPDIGPTILSEIKEVLSNRNLKLREWGSKK